MGLSVIVLNFNHAKLLPRAVAALMAQMPPPGEVIIVDDASTDDSLAVIASLKERFPRIKLIHHEQNKGAAAGMNEGMHSATKEEIYFAAADDYTLPGFFSSAARALAQYPEAAYFCGRVVLVDPQGKILGFRPFMQPAAGSIMVTPTAARAQLAVSDNWSVGSSVIYRRRRLMEAGGFDETMGSFCDGIIVRQLALESGFYFDSTVLACWERYSESLSARSALNIQEGMRLHTNALAKVKASFPADIRKDYADRLGRRLRFNMALQWLFFRDRRIDAKSMADVLQFTGLARTVLEYAARLPTPRVAMTAWMFLALRPYGFSAIIVGWYRETKTRILQSAAVARMIAEARGQFSDEPRGSSCIPVGEAVDEVAEGIPEG
jgi:glycosyltransferase involved in cell wall biosynthesis